MGGKLVVPMPVPRRPTLVAALLAAVSFPASAPAQTAERPLLKAVDEWRFVVHHGQRATTPNRVWRVLDMSAQGIDATEMASRCG